MALSPQLALQQAQLAAAGAAASGVDPVNSFCARWHLSETSRQTLLQLPQERWREGVRSGRWGSLGGTPAWGGQVLGGCLPNMPVAGNIKTNPWHDVVLSPFVHLSPHTSLIGLEADIRLFSAHLGVVCPTSIDLQLLGTPWSGATSTSPEMEL